MFVVEIGVLDREATTTLQSGHILETILCSSLISEYVFYIKEVCLCKSPVVRAFIYVSVRKN